MDQSQISQQNRQPDQTRAEAAHRSEPPNPSRLTGHQIGRYLVGRRLGSGGAATVYQAYDQVRGRSVALKVLLPGADGVTRSRFRQEARTVAGLRHPHIVQTLQVGDATGNGIAYIGMELIEGESLAKLLERRGRLSPAESCNLLDPVARALEYAHGQGIIHRDVKPSNILLRPVSPGAPGSVQLEALDHPVVPLLSDFGIARALDMPELTNVGRTIGTPAYMAPEQCAGSRDVTGRTDIYSLGAVLYRCLVGRAPFNGTTTQILHAHVYAPLSIPDDLLATLSPAVVNLLRRSLAKEPEERYSSAREMAVDLAAVAGRSLAQEAGLDDVTSTLTLASLPAAGGPQPPTETVIVPARRGQTTTAPPVPSFPITDDLAAFEEPKPSRRPPARLVGAALGSLAVVALLAVLIVAAGTFPFERLLPAATPSTTVAAVSLSGTDPAVEQMAPPVEPPPTPTGAPAATETQAAAVPPATDQPTPTATAVPTETATELPTEPPTPVPTATSTPLPPSPTAPPTPQPTQPAQQPQPTPPQSTPPPSAEPEPPEKSTPPGDAEPIPLPVDEPPIVACQYVTAGEFYRLLNANPSVAQELGCPKDVPSAVAYEIQPFQTGIALGRQDQPTVYIRYASNNEWEQRAHNWRPDMPERIDDPELAPPGPGLFQPVRGIGQVWAQNLAVRQALGWATAQAEPASGVLQSFDGGLLIFNEQTQEVYAFLKSQLRL